MEQEFSFGHAEFKNSVRHLRGYNSKELNM